MRHRVLTAVAAAWAAGYLALYLGIIHGEGGGPAWWYVGLLLIAIGLLVYASARPAGRAASAAAAVVLGFCTVIAGLSIGLLLLPALIVAVASLASRTNSRRPTTKGA